MNEELSRAVKEGVADPAQAPTLHDRLHAEAGRLIDAQRTEAFDLNAPVSDEAIVLRIEQYETLTEDLAHSGAAMRCGPSGDHSSSAWRRA